jgi:peptide/nickel transport system permease protein
VSAGPTELLTPGGAVTADVVLESDVAARSPFELFWRRLRTDRVAMVALIFVVVLVLVAILAPLVVKIFGAPSPAAQNPQALDEFGTPTGPSSAHLMGVDQLGRDIFSRVIYGARVSLEVAIISTAIAVFLGVLAGMVAGYYGGRIDTALARMMDVMLGFPSLLLGIGLASACSLGNGCIGGLIKPGLTVVIIVIALAAFPYIARIIRGQVLSLREKEFVEAARSLGASDTRIIFRQILPNLAAPIIVYSTLIIPQNILFEASLSFLGVGVQPPTASWGQMIGDAVGIFSDAWWYMLFPGIALVFTVLAFNLVGDGLQDALDPKTGR